MRQPNIAAYESGSRTPSAQMLSRLLDAARPRAPVVVARNRHKIRGAATANHAGNVRVFGSIARGEDTPDSDIDLIVTFEPDADVLDQVGLVQELEALLDRNVDVVSDRALTERDSAILGEAVPL